jgi:FKBP-type peptidyl-prolyl cis-trans isomerase (trigger factor)
MIKRKKLDFVQFKIRLRESLRKQLEDAARAKDVSINSEIISRLEESFSIDSVQDAIKGELRRLSDRFDKEIERRGRGSLSLLQMAQAWMKLAAQQADKEKAESMSRTAQQLIKMAAEQDPELLSE